MFYNDRVRRPFLGYGESSIKRISLNITTVSHHAPPTAAEQYGVDYFYDDRLALFVLITRHFFDRSHFLRLKHTIQNFFRHLNDFHVTNLEINQRNLYLRITYVHKWYAQLQAIFLKFCWSPCEINSNLNSYTPLPSQF